MKVSPSCTAAKVAYGRIIVLAGLVILFGHSSLLRAQYGPRSWTPPFSGNYYSLQFGGTNFVPTPFLPFDPIDVPVYPVLGTTNSFVYDDTEIDLSGSFSPSSNVPDPPPGPGGTNDPPPSYVRTYGSNDLWLEWVALDQTNQQAYLTLHGTTIGHYYELLQKDALNFGWDFANVPVLYDSTGTNQVYFDPVSIVGHSQSFFAAVQGYPKVSIRPTQYFGTGIEPLGTNSGSQAKFDVILSDPLSTNITVVYTIRGSADNGVDYDTNPNSITLAAGMQTTNIIIQPKPDSIVEFTESVVLSLVLTNGYVIEPTNAIAAVGISDNYTTNANGTAFELVTNNFSSIIGIDYSPTLDSLLASVNGFNGQPSSFVRLCTNSSGQFIVTNWSGLHDIPDEVKLATVKTTTAGFTIGDMFFGNDTNVARLTADGTSSNLIWCTLTNGFVTNALNIRGGLYIDQTGVWSNHLIVVTSDPGDSLTGKGIWTVDSDRHPTLLANITTRHLEGVVTLPNTNSWGPWAGKIITGDEDFFIGGEPIHPRIYAADTNGGVTYVELGIAPEDFDIVPNNVTNYDLYCTVAGTAIYKLPGTMFANYEGSLLITEAGEKTVSGSPNGSLYIVNYDTATSHFIIRSIMFPDGNFEHVTFAKIHLPTLP